MFFSAYSSLFSPLDFEFFCLRCCNSPPQSSTFFTPLGCFPPSPLLQHYSGEFSYFLGPFFLLTICFFSYYSSSFFGFGAAFPPPHGSFPPNGSSFFPPLACFPPSLPLEHHTGKFFHLLDFFFHSQFNFFCILVRVFLGLVQQSPPLLAHSPYPFPLCGLLSPFPPPLAQHR